MQDLLNHLVNEAHPVLEDVSACIDPQSVMVLALGLVQEPAQGIV